LSAAAANRPATPEMFKLIGSGFPLCYSATFKMLLRPPPSHIAKLDRQYDSPDSNVDSPPSNSAAVDIGGATSSAAHVLESSTVSPVYEAESQQPRTSMTGTPPMALPQSSSATTELAAMAPPTRILRCSAPLSTPEPLAPPPPPMDLTPSPPPLHPVPAGIEYVFTGAPAPSPLSLLALRAFYRAQYRVWFERVGGSLQFFQRLIFLNPLGSPVLPLRLVLLVKFLDSVLLLSWWSQLMIHSLSLLTIHAPVQMN